MILDRNKEENQRNGKYIRSFYPELLDAPAGLGDSTGRKPILANSATNQGRRMISAACPNPVGVDDGKEWIEVKNPTTSMIDLTGGQLQDRFLYPEPMQGTIAAGATVRVMIPQFAPNAMQLSNPVGRIVIVDPAGTEIFCRHLQPRRSSGGK